MGQSTSSKTYLRLSPCTKLANTVLILNSKYSNDAWLSDEKTTFDTHPLVFSKGLKDW